MQGNLTWKCSCTDTNRWCESHGLQLLRNVYCVNPVQVTNLNCLQEIYSGRSQRFDTVFCSSPHLIELVAVLLDKRSVEDLTFRCADQYQLPYFWRAATQAVVTLEEEVGVRGWREIENEEEITFSRAVCVILLNKPLNCDRACDLKVTLKVTDLRPQAERLSIQSNELWLIKFFFWQDSLCSSMFSLFL